MILLTLPLFFFLQTTDETLVAAVTSAIRHGYRHIDTAPFYNVEPSIGKAINDAISRGEVKREDLFVTSKVIKMYFFHYM